MCYSIYSWCSPGMIVLLSIILDQIDSSIFSPRYAQSFCYISNQTALWILFGAPVSILLVADLAFYCMAVKEIHSAAECAKVIHGKDKQGMKLAHAERQRRIWIYLKLLIVMGLTWLFGFLASAVDRLALWYIYTILNSTQGVMICIAFACTTQVKRLVREHWRRYRGGKPLRFWRSTLRSSETKSTTATYNTATSSTRVNTMEKCNSTWSDNSKHNSMNSLNRSAENVAKLKSILSTSGELSVINKI